MRMGRALTMLGFAVAAGVSLIWVESYNLRLRQKVTELHLERDRLAEVQARLRLTVGQYTAPARIIAEANQRHPAPVEPTRPVVPERTEASAVLSFTP